MTGKAIDVNTADPQTVIRGINIIADDTIAHGGEGLQDAGRAEGSRFYGENTDGVGTFLESANMNADKYRSAGKDYARASTETESTTRKTRRHT